MYKVLIVVFSVIFLFTLVESFLGKHVPTPISLMVKNRLFGPIDEGEIGNYTERQLK